MNIGAAAVARAAPDGYTLFVAPPAPIALAHLLSKNLSYNPLDWVPITMLAKIANVLSVRNEPAGEHAPGADRLRQGQSGQAHLRDAGPDLDRASVGGAARSADRHQDAGGGLSRRAAGAHRRDRRQRRHVLRHARDLGAAASRRQAEDPGGRRPAARQDRAGSADLHRRPACRASARSPGSASSRRPARRPRWRSGSTATPSRCCAARRSATRLQSLSLEVGATSPAETATFFAGETALWGKVIKEAGITPQ